MHWSDRMKRAFNTFKRMALPLYAWYIIIGLIGIVLAIVTLIPIYIYLMHNGMLGSGISGIPGIPGIPFAPEVPGTPVPPFSTPYPNPNPPAPPGNSFTPGQGNFMQNLSPLLTLAPTILLTFFGLILISWLLSSLFLTGLFNLTKTAYTSPRARFRDFRLKGTARVLGWYGILTLISLLLIGVGAAIAFSLREINYAIAIFSGIYMLFLIAIAIFCAPWYFTAAYYMLNHRELPFGKSLKGSWAFYRRHIGSFWGLFLTIIAIQILVVMIDRAFPNLGTLISFLIGPFTAILPIVWVLTHEEEENPPAEPNTPYIPASTPVIGSTLSQPHRSNNQDSPTQSQLQSQSQLLSPTLPPKSVPQEDVSSQNVSSSGTSINPTHPKDTNNYPQPDYPSEAYPPQIYPPQDYPSFYTPKISTDTEENSEPKSCPTCGKSVRPGASYCSQCGTKL